MLERIAEIQGIGLLHNANGKPHTCHKATLIYADNGRGKSTLATIFRSVSTGDVSLIGSCKTVDGTLPPRVLLQFGSGHRVTFENSAWSEQRPEFLVFDADFIGRNVHSGGSVNTDHRKNLLEFALGEAAVTARAAVDKATTESRVASDKVNSLIGQLSGHHQGMTLVQFEQLPQVADVDTKITELEKQLIAASNVVAIQAKPVPRPVAVPSFDIDGLFTNLALSLKDVHVDAEKIVRQHIAKLGKSGYENWLSHGQEFNNGVSCPFCDQDVTNNNLIRAYQTHFNAAYIDLKRKVAGLQQMVADGTSEGVVEGFVRKVEVAVAQVSAWTEHFPTEVIVFNVPAAMTALNAFREFLTDLTRRKQADPAEVVGSAEDKAKAVSLWEKVLSPMHAANANIKSAEEKISRFKEQLKSENVAGLKQQILQLQIAKRRHDPIAIALFAQLVVARANSAAVEREKITAREKLDKLMTTTLNKYQESINKLLRNFGASFSIKEMSANFRGNAPRSEYSLLLRGKDVALEGGPPSFTTTLSDGDKRALAFAFFVASTLEDPKLTNRIVVIDDPMCSLDLNRRHYTRTVLKNLHSKAAQLVVLAHDPYFLRDLRDALKKDDKSMPIVLFQLTAAPQDYSDFSSLDIDKECESVYVKHHRLITEFSTGSGGDTMSVAKAIRPMLEGYLHRRFPGLLPKDVMFGQVVTLIRDSVAPSPLCHAKNVVDVLNEINEYAGQFHHDSNIDADNAATTATEVKSFADKALCVVHKGAPP